MDFEQKSITELQNKGKTVFFQYPHSHTGHCSTILLLLPAIPSLKGPG